MLLYYIVIVVMLDMFVVTRGNSLLSVVGKLYGKVQIKIVRDRTGAMW